jgi:hypothetical protein
MSRKFLDANHPMFRRVWVRWATGVLPLGWGIFEFVGNEAPFWGMLFAGAGAYALYELVWKGPDRG